MLVQRLYHNSGEKGKKGYGYLEPLQRSPRYMDDVMLFVSKAPDWDRERFLQDFERSECYWDPLTLKRTDDGKFLETKFEKKQNGVQFRLKNDNEESYQVWRYHHYQSRLDYTCKRATMLGALKKVEKMASDNDELEFSALAKCKEFLNLGYPRGILRHMCGYLHYFSKNRRWLKVSNKLLDELPDYLINKRPRHYALPVHMPLVTSCVV